MKLSNYQSQQLKQTLCQSQADSLRILEMNNIELKDFLQSVQMENPLLEMHESSMIDSMREISPWCLGESYNQGKRRGKST